MPLAATIFPATLELEDLELGPTQMLDDFGEQRHSLDVGLADRDRIAVGDQHDVLERQLGSGFAHQPRHREHLVRGHACLDTVDVDDGVHAKSPTWLELLRACPRRKLNTRNAGERSWNRGL